MPENGLPTKGSNIFYKQAFRFLYTVVIIAVFILMSSSCKELPSDQEIIADVVANQFSDIDDFHPDSRPMSLDDAEAILYCWASGEEDVSDEDAKEAIMVVLECTDDIRELIYSIDEIDLSNYR